MREGWVLEVVLFQKARTQRHNGGCVFHVCSKPKPMKIDVKVPNLVLNSPGSRHRKNNSHTHICFQNKSDWLFGRRKPHRVWQHDNVREATIRRRSQGSSTWIVNYTKEWHVWISEPFYLRSPTGLWPQRKNLAFITTQLKPRGHNWASLMVSERAVFRKEK